MQNEDHAQLLAVFINHLQIVKTFSTTTKYTRIHYPFPIKPPPDERSADETTWCLVALWVDAQCRCSSIILIALLYESQDTVSSSFEQTKYQDLLH